MLKRIKQLEKRKPITKPTLPIEWKGKKSGRLPLLLGHSWSLEQTKKEAVGEFRKQKFETVKFAS